MTATAERSSTVGHGAGALELFAILPTPFTPDGADLDADAAAGNVARLAGDGLIDVLVGGSYGEFQSLDPDERVALVQAVRATTAGRVMACAAMTSTGATATLAERMLEAGADLVMVAAPLACELTDEDILRHFAALADRAAGRLVVYNNPVFGTDLSPALLGRLVALPGVVGIKQGTRDLAAFAASARSLHDLASGPLSIYAAADLASALTLGAPGVDGLTSTNVWAFPSAFRRIVAAAGAGDGRSVRQIATALSPYAAAVARYGQPASIKTAMSLRGYAGGDAVRLPYAALGPAARANLAAAMAASDDRLAATSD